jgi:ketosteroid isomerase-like protein
MSQENVELNYRFYEAYNRRHLAAALALFDDDVEVDSILVGMEGSYRGHDGIRRLWEDVLNAVPDLTLEAVEVRDLGDSTVAHVRLRGHGAGSDVPFDETLWYVGRWRRGKCVWWGDFRSEAEALEAVGPPEQDAHAES